MDAKKILFIAQEVSPYVADNPRSLAGRALPQGMVPFGYEARIFMPRYGAINERRNQLHEVIRLSGLNIPIDDTDHQLVIKVATMMPTRTQVYFIDNDDYFHRRSSKGLETETHPSDNDERLIFYTRAVIETVKKLRWPPAVIHCQGWLTALVPMYLKKMYSDDPALCKPKVIFTLTDNRLPAPLNEKFIPRLKNDGVKDPWLKPLKEVDRNAVDNDALLRQAVQYADIVAIGSPGVDPQWAARAAELKKTVVPYADVTTPQGVKTYADLYQTIIG